MTQDERCLAKYEEVKRFVEDKKRNPSKYVPEERLLVNWAKQQRKLDNKGELRQERVEMFGKLVDMWEKFRRVNQYQ